MGEVIGVVPVAGFGSRLKPLTNVLPKELLPVGRHLIVERVISELKSAGIHKLVFVVSPSKHPIFELLLGDGEKFGVHIDYAIQNHMGGLADAVLCSQAYVSAGSRLLIALGDSFFSGGTDGGVVQRMLQTDTDGAIATRDVPNDLVNRYGIVSVNPASNEIAYIVEKPLLTEAPSTIAVCARYLVDTTIFETIMTTKPSDGTEHQLTGCLNQWIDSGKTLATVPLQGQEKRHDVGNFDTYYASVVDMALTEANDRPHLERTLKEYLQ